MARAARPKHTPSVDFNLLSREEQEGIREKARLQVEAERRKAAEDAFLAKEVEAARKASGLDFDDPDDVLEEVVVDLPGHSDRLVIDSVHYMHGRIYKLPRKQVRSVKEMMQRAWDHENEVGGANRNAYRKPRDARIQQRGAGDFSVLRA